MRRFRAETRRATQAKFSALLRGDRRSGLRGSACLLGRCGRLRASVRAARPCLVVDLGGNGVDGVDLHGHGQFVQVAVVENAAARSDFKRALLLLLRALDVFVVTDDLQPEETCRDGECPEEKEAANKPETRQPHRRGARCNGARTNGSECCLHVDQRWLSFQIRTTRPAMHQTNCSMSMRRQLRGISGCGAADAAPFKIASVVRGWRAQSTCASTGALVSGWALP